MSNKVFTISFLPSAALESDELTHVFGDRVNGSLEWRDCNWAGKLLKTDTGGGAKAKSGGVGPKASKDKAVSKEKSGGHKKSSGKRSKGGADEKLLPGGDLRIGVNLVAFFDVAEEDEGGDGGEGEGGGDDGILAGMTGSFS